MGLIALQSGHQWAHRNSTTGLPLRLASVGDGAASASLEATSKAGWPSRLSRLMFLLMRWRIDVSL